MNRHRISGGFGLSRLFGFRVRLAVVMVVSLCGAGLGYATFHSGVIPYLAAPAKAWEGGEPPVFELTAGSGERITGWIGVSDTGVLLRVDVEDREHRNAAYGADIYDGDSIQFYLDGRGDGTEGRDPDREWIGSDDLSLCLALTDAGPQAWLHHSGRNIDGGWGSPTGGAEGPVSLVFDVSRKGDAVTQYRATVPWTLLQTPARWTRRLGFALTVNNGSGEERREIHFGQVEGGQFRPGGFVRMPVEQTFWEGAEVADKALVRTPTRPPPVELVTTATAQLEPIPIERRLAWKKNQEGRIRVELDAEIDALGQIEVRNEADGAVDPQRLRIVAWNIQFARNPEASIRLLHEHPSLTDADIILLSEVDHGVGRSENRHFTRELASALGMNYAFGVEFLELPGGLSDFDTGMPDTHGYTGNAILAKPHLKNVRMLRFPQIYNLWYNDVIRRLGGRMALLAEIETPAGDITLISTHLESQNAAFREPSDLRGIQVDAILESVSQLPPAQPVVLGGDLNARPTHLLFETLQTAGFSLAASNNLDQGSVQRVRDGRNVFGDYRIDFICLRGIETIESESSPGTWLAAYPSTAEGTPLSDHAVISVDARWSEE